MKCTNKKKILNIFLSIGLSVCLTGCGQLKFDMPYDANTGVSGFNVIADSKSAKKAEAFAADLCVITEDIMDNESVDMSQAQAAVLFDLNNTDVLYAKNAHERLYPASLTKVMTALVALQHCSMDQKLVATDSVVITESGAQLCGLKSGDTMTMSQALHILLLYSANDVAMLIAENVGGSVDGFIDMMNEEAKRIGATNTHFTNPHGLTDEEHYTTAYDLYLIFENALNYEAFNEIIHMSTYQTTYYDSQGNPKELSFETTNRFLRGHFAPPENVTVIGGKTGTTNAAGHCLMLFSKDTNGAPYISIILRSEANDILYQEMVDLLDEINK